MRIYPHEVDALAAVEELFKDGVGVDDRLATELAISVADLIDEASGTDLAGKWSYLVNEEAANGAGR
jgi:hypothetical protein